MVGTGRHVDIRSLAAGACEAVFLGKSFQGCVPCHSLILPPASGCRLYHPASLQKRPEVPAPSFCALVSETIRQNFATTALGVCSVRASSEQMKRYFRQRVQIPLMFHLKCGLIAASPARAATPAPRHSRAPAAIPRQSPQNQGGRRLCGGPEAQSCAGDPCCNSAACGPRTPTFRSWKPPLVITRVCTASVHPQWMQSVPCARPFGTCHGGGAHLLQM